MHRRGWVIVVVLALAALAAGGLIFRRALIRMIRTTPRNTRVMDFIRNPEVHTDWIIPAGSVCPGAAFQFPTDGFIGYLWDDSFEPLRRHTGLDIFGGAQPGFTPVYAAYDGYLTRLTDWKSTVIQRIPSDPLQPGQQIWLYYTHLADPQGVSFVDAAFPPGTSEVFVPAGTLLGRQGNFSGTPGSPVGVHLHFSIVRDDGAGKFLNESIIDNTIDPSPYFRMRLNADEPNESVPGCESNSS